MKIFLSITLVFFAVFFWGCGADSNSPVEEEKEIKAYVLKETLWVADSSDMEYLNDAIDRKDIEYLEQLMIEGKVFLVEKDTKVICFGKVIGKNNVLIQFKEGRYTNKTGCTHASNVVKEKEYPSYVENQKKKLNELIQKCLTDTEDYSRIIAMEDMAQIKILRSTCLNNTNILKAKIPDDDVYTRECLQAAVDIIFERDGALLAYERSIEYLDKLQRENPASKNYRVYESMQKDFRNDIDKYSQKAEKKRQEFRDKYGF